MSRHHRGPAQVALAGTRECAICPDAAARDALVCTGHRDEIGHMLDPAWTGDPARRIPASIPVFWSQLDPTPGRAGGEQRRAPGFASAPPCSLDVIVMTDPRSRPNAVVPVWIGAAGKVHYEPDGQPRPVAVALHHLVAGVWARWGYVGPDLPNGDVIGRRTVGALAGWLHTHRDRICSDLDVAVVHRFLAEILRDLRHACGDRDEPPVGRCTAWLPRPRGERVLCNHPIYPPVPTPDQCHSETDDQVTECGGCGTKYGRLDRYRLARAERDSRRAPSVQSA